MSLTWKQAWARRLARHCLLDRAASGTEGLVRTVSAVCGIHAQVMPAAELSVGIRVGGVTRGDVQAALWETRLLVKTFGIRGTCTSSLRTSYRSGWQLCGRAPRLM